MARIDPAVQAHLEWLGFVQPTGLVVSAPALVQAGAILPRDADGQRRLRDRVEERTLEPDGPSLVCLPDFEKFAADVLDWDFTPAFFAGTPERPIPEELVVVLTDHGETLRPDLAVAEPDPTDDGPAWQLLVRTWPLGTDLDRPLREGGTLDASPHSRMERLLRTTGVTAGLLTNGTTFRLLSAPRGESSGWIDFHVAEMVPTAGRPIVAALRLLLGQARLLALPRPQRLAALLTESRRFQNQVSERLAEQVLHALYELLRGFQAAHDASGGELLAEPLAEDPDEVYRALLTVVLRLVFLLYAEERDMLPGDETFLRHYALSGLYARLRDDAALHPDTMEQRYGAWAQLLVLFRLVHDGADLGATRLPRRHGVLFDPDRYPFLEGRGGAGARQVHERVAVPLVPDGAVWRALEKLCVLDGERISYRALDVEQIGSVYETMMGFRITTATGPSVAIRAPKPHGAPTTVDLQAMLAQSLTARAKWLAEQTDRKVTDRVRRAVVEARTVDDLHHALDPIIDRAATPDRVPPGALVLQPSPERRRSGSHYTPRSLTEPIVRTTLEPVLAGLRGADGRPPQPDRILDLKVCDPAMGSGAFLVEACRQLADALVEAWDAHDATPPIPPDEDVVVFARRLVAQRCLYGVDRNPVAVDLAKVSLWLATLARDHAFTFVDHALHHGDSLVGLSRRQLEAFHWAGDRPAFTAGLEALRAREHLERVGALRAEIRDATEEVSDDERRGLWEDADAELESVRLLGDLVVAAYLDHERPREREDQRLRYAATVVNGTAGAHRMWLEARRGDDPPLAPFHWEVELPEVFERERPGFDAIVGNPPFSGHVALIAANSLQYAMWLREMHPGAGGKCDLVAHFFRRAFTLLRVGGAFGLIATNTIAQGDTRASGLRWICTHGGEIYAARRRLRWPGAAAVVVSVVHVHKGPYRGPRRLDGREVATITAFLADRGGHDDPARLAANAGKSFVGSYVLGMGFTFDDTDTKGVANPVAEMRRLLAANPANAEVIFPYIGGEEVNRSPTHTPHRWVIDFGERSEDECRRRWPELMAIVETKVKPERLAKTGKHYEAARTRWWQFFSRGAEMRAAIAGLDRVLVVNCGATPHAAFTFLPTGVVYAHTLAVFPLPTFGAFCGLQSRVHELWARFFGSSMKEDLRYTASDCFETFPFPEDWETDPALEAAGRDYYEFRADLMVRTGEGLTKTYNRFHDPHEHDPDIVQLRDLHAAMDRAVLDAYGWTDLPTDCEFLPDHPEDESGATGRVRYRWPDEVRDEVLARLLELNAERAAAEARAGRHRASGPARRTGRRAPGPAEGML